MRVKRRGPDQRLGAEYGFSRGEGIGEFTVREVGEALAKRHCVRSAGQRGAAHRSGAGGRNCLASQSKLSQAICRLVAEQLHRRRCRQMPFLGDRAARTIRVRLVGLRDVFSESTLRQPFQQMGIAAIELLPPRIASLDGPVESRALPVQSVERDWVASPRRERSTDEGSR